MEPQEQPPTTNTRTPQSQKHTKLIVVIVATILVFAGGLYGVYAWQKHEADKKQTALQKEITTLEAKANQSTADTTDPSITADSATKNVVYKSKVGGLTLTLPADKYDVIVKVDGNKGGAPGATLRLGKILSPGIVEDSSYIWNQVDIDNYGSTTTLDQETKGQQAKLAQEGFDKTQVTNTTFKGVPARIIKATSSEIGNETRQVYVVKSGEFLYTFTTSNGDPKANPDFQVLIDSAIIEPKTL